MSLENIPNNNLEQHAKKQTLTPEKLAELERKFNNYGDTRLETDKSKIGHNIEVGDEVYYEGDIYKVFAFSEQPGSIRKVEDWEASPYGDIIKEKVSNGQVMTIRKKLDDGGTFSIGVDPSLVVKVTDQNKDKIENMIN